MQEKKFNIAVFASGGGSNFKAIFEAIKSGRLDAQIKILVVSKHGTGAEEFANINSVPVLYYISEEHKSKEDMAKHMLFELNKMGTDLIVLAGFLKLVDSAIVKEYSGRIINIHPALLPSFGGKGCYGIHVHEKVLEYGARVTGVTVHFVDEEYDRGAIILQRAINVSQDDTPQSLQKRVLEHEHDLYWRAVKLIMQNRIKLEGRKVKILGDIDD